MLELNEFVYTGKTPYSLTGNSDISNLPTGVYRMTNPPVGNYSWGVLVNLISREPSSTWNMREGIQMFVPADAAYPTYIRPIHEDTWTDWRQL